MDTPDGGTYFAKKVWGVSMRYDLGDAHPLVGRGAPDFELADGTRIGSLLRDGKGLLLDFDPGAPRQALGRGWDGRINYIPGHAENAFGLSAIFVRPDGFVAWASEGVEDDEGLAQAASRWLGNPATLDR
jgi:hypothetical protein